jgi:hypothetical protein
MVLPEAHEEGDSIHPNQTKGGDEAAPSCFLEGTRIQYAWDSTSLEALKKCPRYYQLTMIDNWQLRGDAIHLRWGQEFHYAIEDYERSRATKLTHDDSVFDTVRALVGRIAGWEPAPRTKSEELKSKDNLLRTVVWYLDHYENDAAETVILANGKPAVELSFAFELEFGPERAGNRKFVSYGVEDGYVQPYLLCGHLDKVVRFSGDLFVMDHKTTTSTPGGYFFDNFNPHNQMTVYTIASQTIMKSPIKGVIIDAVQIAVGFSRPVRGITYRTNDQLEEWLGDTQRWLRAAEGYAEEDFWPMNDTACGMYGGCRFREVCSKSPSVRQKWLESNFTQENERWNPLKPR